MDRAKFVYFAIIALIVTYILRMFYKMIVNMSDNQDTWLHEGAKFSIDVFICRQLAYNIIT